MQGFCWSNVIIIANAFGFSNLQFPLDLCGFLFLYSVYFCFLEWVTIQRKLALIFGTIYCVWVTHSWLLSFLLCFGDENGQELLLSAYSPGGHFLSCTSGVPVWVWIPLYLQLTEVLHISCLLHDMYLLLIPVPSRLHMCFLTFLFFFFFWSISGFSG